MAVRVAVRRASGDLHADILRAIETLGNGAPQLVNGRSVLIKANFNSPHGYPATTAPDFLSALILTLRGAGAARVAVGDSCGLRWGPAARVARALGIPEIAAGAGAAWINFDDGPWREVAVGGADQAAVKVAEAAFGVDLLIYACCMKTHRRAGFSMSLKHAVGFLPPDQRNAIHDGDIGRNIARINRAVRPDLILLDARRCFAAGGPAIGWVRRPGLIMASADRVALDVEGLKVLGGYLRLNRLRRNPWDEPQIRAASASGAGIRGKDEYEVVEA